MKLSSLAPIPFVWSLVPSLVGAVAIPDTPPQNETLAKRGGEVYYLANCLVDNLVGTQMYTASYVAWYSNVDASQNWQTPDMISSEYRDWSRGGDYLLWEGYQQNLWFPENGISFRSEIDWDAQSRSFKAKAGYGWRSSDWYQCTCWKDNGRELFEDIVNPGGGQNDRFLRCWSIYWCGN